MHDLDEQKDRRVAKRGKQVLKQYRATGQDCCPCAPIHQGLLCLWLATTYTMFSLVDDGSCRRERNDTRLCNKHFDCHGSHSAVAYANPSDGLKTRRIAQLLTSDPVSSR